ncbi:MAG: PepSY domain-containing protein [Rhodoferax sp.]
MRTFFQARSWHTWASVILALPLLIVGITAIFITHKKSLGTDEVVLWSRGASAAHAPEVRTVLPDAQGVVWLGTQEGLLRLDAGMASPVAEFDGIPVRALAQAPWGLVAAAKNGIWVLRDGTWSRALRTDAFGASLVGNAEVAVTTKDEGVLISRNGRDWQAHQAWNLALEMVPAHGGARPMTLDKFIMDLHTGVAVLGKGREWIWIDVLGLCLVLLGLTGLTMWWRQERRKAQLRQSTPATPTPASQEPAA